MKTWFTGTSVYTTLSPEDRCKLMILLRGPYSRSELALLLNVKRSTIHGWEKLGKLPRFEHLRGLLFHFSEWYVDRGVPGTLGKALAEITGKKDLTTTQKPDTVRPKRTRRTPQPYPREEQ